MEEEMEGRVKNRIFFIIVLALFFASLIILTISIVGNFPLKTYEVPITVKVSNTTAFNISTGQKVLDLGTIAKGSGAFRNLSIQNNYDFPVLFEFEVLGNIKNLLIYPPNLILESREASSVKFETIIIHDEPKGVYSGTIVVKLRKA